LTASACDVVKVGTFFVASKVTDDGTSGDIVKVIALTVAGAIARLKMAVIALPLPATPVVLFVADWLPLLGDDEVTMGIVGPATEHAAPGTITVVPTTPPPPPPPHPATKTTSSNSMDHVSSLATLSNPFIGLLSLSTRDAPVRSTRPWSSPTVCTFAGRVLPLAPGDSVRQRT
jgi:hypothetical protein